MPVLRREFSPFDGLLQLATASDQDLNSRCGTYQPRKVVFKRYHDRDNNGVILSPGGFAASKPHSRAIFMPTQGRTAKKNTGQTFTPSPRTATIWEGDINRILSLCLVVRKWELRFPQLRWIYEPANCRSLKDNEKERFRRALYRWWLHAFYFHGDLPRPRVGMPSPFVDDPRTSHMRTCHTGELLELRDLVATVKNLISHYIIPVLEQGVAWSQDQEAIIASSQSTAPLRLLDEAIQNRIVDTYAKLDPKELMFYWENLYNYPKRRLITDIRIQHPNFSRDLESLEAAVESALLERHGLNPYMLAERHPCFGGIFDLDDESEAKRDQLEHDASPDGSLPSATAFVQPSSERPHMGDDGSRLDESAYRYSRSGRPIGGAGTTPYDGEDDGEDDVDSDVDSYLL